MNFLRTDVICMSNVLKYHSAKDPGKVDSPFEVRFDMNASRKRKNTKPKGFFEKLKEQRNQRKADRAKQTDRKTDILKKTGSGRERGENEKKNRLVRQFVESGYWMFA